jgi:hypothetical protein
MTMAMLDDHDPVVMAPAPMPAPVVFTEFSTSTAKLHAAAAFVIAANANFQFFRAYDARCRNAQHGNRRQQDLRPHGSSSFQVGIHREQTGKSGNCSLVSSHIAAGIF